MLKLLSPLPPAMHAAFGSWESFYICHKTFCGNVNILLVLHGTCHGLNTWQEFHKFATACAICCNYNNSNTEG